jgi:catechol 2,3-dioxygenase-like lactoylglutathione lyase family enzyme
MRQSIIHIALVVRDYDEAIAFHTGTLGFTLVENTAQPEQGKRWVVGAPPGDGGTTLLLARAATPEQEAFVGNQAGGRVFLFLRTDDFWRDYQTMQQRGVSFVREPTRAEYGIVAVFADLYGNRWDLIEFPSTTRWPAADTRATGASRVGGTMELYHDGNSPGHKPSNQRKPRPPPSVPQIRRRLRLGSPILACSPRRRRAVVDLIAKH